MDKLFIGEKQLTRKKKEIQTNSKKVYSIHVFQFNLKTMII